MNPGIYRLLPAVGDLMISSGNPLDLHAMVVLISPACVVKALWIVWILSNFRIHHCQSIFYH